MRQTEYQAGRDFTTKTATSQAIINLTDPSPVAALFAAVGDQRKGDQSDAKSNDTTSIEKQVVAPKVRPCFDGPVSGAAGRIKRSPDVV